MAAPQRDPARWPLDCERYVRLLYRLSHHAGPQCDCSEQVRAAARSVVEWLCIATPTLQLGRLPALSHTHCHPNPAHGNLWRHLRPA